jgi:outer membrane receptor for ferrienterochelin and colicins
MAKGKPAYTMVDVGVNISLYKNIQVMAGVYNSDKEIDTETYDYVLDGRRYNLGRSIHFNDVPH